MAQTAVEWFADKLYDSNGDAWENASTRQIQINIDVSEYLKLKQQAKQMEMEQHKDTWDAGMGEGIGTTMGCVDYDGEFINYYTQTYNQNK